MTCIVGLVHGGQVILGADSAGVSGMDLVVRADQKVWAKDGWIFGFTTSFRMGQLLRYSLQLPKRNPDVDLMQFMATEFVDAVRACLKAGGFATARDGGEAGGDFLVGHAGRLFRVCSDYQVAEAQQPFDAVGCGAPYATGALFALANSNVDGFNRVVAALNAAQAMSAGVRAPFTIVATEPPPQAVAAAVEEPAPEAAA